ncbi:MAG: hypothetical protein OHK0052_04870 [Anaerolineales bacterium]
MARFAFYELNARNAAVLYDVANEYNRTVAQIFIASFTALGGAVQGYEYTTGQQDFTETMKKIAQQQPDVLFLPNYYNEVLLQIPQARQMGLNVPIIGTDTWGGLKAENYAEVDSTFYASHWHVDSPQQQSQDFVALYQNTYGTIPIATAAMTYDAINLLADAIQQANTLEGAAIADALRTADLNGVSGVIRYTGDGDPVKSAVILQIKDGELKVYKLYNP